MKRKLLLLDVGLLLLLGGYSAVGWWKLRGAGAYRMGTTLGTVLSLSCPYTTLAAFVLLAITVAVLLVWFRKRRKAKSVEPLEGTASEVKKKRKGKQTQPEPETEQKIQPARGNADPEATVPMEDETTVPMDDEATVPMEETTAAGEVTVPMEETVHMAEETPPLEKIVSIEAESSVSHKAASALDKSASTVSKAAAESERDTEAGLPRCASCGAVMKPGQRFCTRCGTPVKGDVTS